MTEINDKYVFFKCYSYPLLLIYTANRMQQNVLNAKHIFN